MMSGEPPRKRLREKKTSTKLSLSPDYTNRSEDPLSNYAILKNIFSNLDNTDIESCCQVNKFWNSIADPLFVRHYDVILQVPYRTYLHCTSVLISKPSTYDSRRRMDYETSLEDASNILEGAIQTHKIAINFKIKGDNENEEIITNFLSKFGNLVQKMAVDDGIKSRRLCGILVRFFPNLQQLDLTRTHFAVGDDLYFDEILMNNCMKRLRRTVFDAYSVSYLQPWINIFRMAPCLEEIHGFPMIHVDALLECGKGHCLKSFQCLGSETYEELRAALEKMANLDLTLKSFEFYFESVRPENICAAAAQIEPFARRILESSRDSLENLSLYRTEAFGFQSISPMNAVKTVIFRLTSELHGCPIIFFSPETLLPTLFPKASNVEILTPLSYYPVSHIASWFPEIQFAPWGIRKLKIEHASLRILRVIGRAFPGLADFEFCLGSGGDGLQILIHAIGNNWPDIEFLTIRGHGRPNYPTMEDGWSFDSVFTGIRTNDLDRLGSTDPLVWDTVFSSTEMKHFKELSPFRKFSKLKVLKFDLTDGYFGDAKIVEKLSAVTIVSKEFGFQVLPELKIVVRTEQKDDSDDWQMSIYEPSMYLLLTFGSCEVIFM